LSGGEINEFVVGDLVADNVAKRGDRVTPAADILERLDVHALFAGLFGGPAMAQMVRREVIQGHLTAIGHRLRQIAPPQHADAHVGVTISFWDFSTLSSQAASQANLPYRQA